MVLTKEMPVRLLKWDLKEQIPFWLQVRSYSVCGNSQPCFYVPSLIVKDGPYVQSWKGTEHTGDKGTWHFQPGGFPCCPWNSDPGAGAPSLESESRNLMHLF